MIKFNGTDAEGNRVIGLGIVQGTYSKMLAGEMMTVDLTVLGVPGVKLIVLAGRDEISITRDLQSAIGQQTHVHVDPTAIIRKAGG